MRYYNREHVEQALSIQLAIELSQVAFALQSQGKVMQSVRSIIPAPDGRLMGTMPAYISEGKYSGFGLKSVLVDFNPHQGAASHEGCILLFDEQANGEMVTVDAGSITELRTAAASAWATHLLAPPQATRLAILGTGLQARKHLLTMLAVRPIEQVTIWGRNPTNVDQFATWCAEHPVLNNITITIAETPAEAVSDADIICTVTAARAPLLHLGDLPQSCHINAVGASAIGFQELDPAIYGAVEHYVDSQESCWNASQCLQQAKEKGYLPSEHLSREIGELGTHIPENRPKRTLFKSVGLAVQDLVFAREVLHQNQSNPT
ncbi:L-lysine cyclodeaminase [Vibrio ruber DSM 16370]|uniref:L-lysine cyclodeaminase n=1 Tax=Vibrio ruber (strain DSM 16370 / JCM 11486 / BCRC 17186 / CECT 7878 / LMG 23124 / VR1) TaxID=1123498 RepID=A0A1R4LR76_VIBR1|nr:ornithine cyclodeaminase family protein [Vibrio ruber]SJN58988.1 L-lysine cyclodeaminase [Vibrio ruber DSM 16370]